jgi:hypothetical protein
MQALPLWLGLALAAPHLVHAQTTASPAPLTREQIKMERDEFVRTHRYDPHTENWVMKPGFEAPTGVKTREQVRAERDEFLRNNRFDYVSGSWIPLKGSTGPESTRTRAQIREETRQFMRTHQWDTAKEVWLEVKPVAKKSKP